MEHHHRDLSGGGARAAVFGISDGLVSNISLILAMAGGQAGAQAVRLAGVAGLIAGACSMAAGEYVSMRAQSELVLRELDIERRAIRADPEDERRELAAIYVGRGLDQDMAAELSTRLMQDPETALETHAREELGIDPRRTGNPFQAAAASFATFALGAFVPLLPWLLTSGAAAVVGSVVLGVLAALIVGVALSHFSGRTWWRSAGRQVLILAGSAGVTYGIGRLVGSA